MVEEGLPYRVDILASSSAELRIRSHSPGGFVEARFVPAEEPTDLKLVRADEEPSTGTSALVNRARPAPQVVPSGGEVAS